MKKKMKYVIAVSILLLTMTGCTKYLKDADNKTVVNPLTGQSMTDNILCQPTDSETIKIYTANGYDLSNLPRCVCENETYTESVYTDGEYKDIEYKCNSFKINSGEYEGLWESIFVKPLAWLILFIGKNVNSFGLGLILTSILIRLVVLPFTKKSAMQSESMKVIQPKLDKIEKKYANKDLNNKEIAMMKSQEIMAVYKENNFNPISGCLVAFLQLPLFIAFLEAINRVPAIFEEKFLFWHLGTSPSVGISNGNWWYIIIILLVALTTYYSFRKTMNSTGNADTVKQTKTMTNVFLVVIVVSSVFMTSALGIYWVTSNLFSIVQNYLVKRSIKK